jgi:hypothetical protein
MGKLQRLKNVLIWNRQSEQQSSKTSLGCDPGNGFGAKTLLRSPSRKGVIIDDRDPFHILNGVQILTRYCEVERPYFSAFLEHYASLGVKHIHVCVQSDSDASDLDSLPSPEALQVYVHRIHAYLDPSAAIKTFNLKKIAEIEDFTMMVDCDEYFEPLRKNLPMRRLFETFPNINQFFIPWLMKPIVFPGDEHRDGFWGHTGKPIVRSSAMLCVKNDHSFTAKQTNNEIRETSAPCGIFGFAIVHYWSRSMKDCLLKVFNNRFVDAKSSDLAEALRIIRSGGIPVRMRLLAYLYIQDGFINLPSAPISRFDSNVEKILLSHHLSQEEEEICKNTFKQYCLRLKAYQHSLPLYPTASLKSLAKTLPVK